MATIINPITTVLVSREEFESGEYDRFMFKYILESDGTITYYSRLTAGRYLYSHEAQIPGLGINRTIAAPAAEFQPLAHGHKIPGEFFEQIRQFFLDVMDLGPSTYEAQVFVVWNENSKEYRIIIPKQTVSAAAVRYDIGDVLGDGDVIILDVHSHNNMGAFFSGTDDRDDKKNPWISGVFGKLSTNLEYKFRFNDGCGRHFEMKMEDIFDIESTRFRTPKEWLDQVEIQTSAAKSTGVRQWGQVYDFSDVSRERDGFIAPHESGIMEDGYDWLAPDPEADLYDAITDELHELSNDECRAVIEALQTSLSTIDFAPTLTDREMSAYVATHYYVDQCKDPLIIDRVLTSLARTY